MTSYPQNDDDFEEMAIDNVSQDSGGGYAITCGGWTIHCGKDFHGAPHTGETARFYPKDNLGRRVRGLFVNGQKAWYRTEAEDEEYSDIQRYGADAADWLKRWDDGVSVWSIEMGGLGPGYEQCIQITAAEILRHLLAAKYDAAKWEDAEAWAKDRAAIEKNGFANERVKVLGLSGAQWGAAVNLATHLYKSGPRAVAKDPHVKDRKIQVSRVFPGMAA